MKKYILICCIAISFLSFTQTAQETYSKKEFQEFKETIIDKFKKTTTIFVFSNVYEKEVYEEILKKSWTITPYKIVDYKDFNTLEYIKKGKYSFASIRLSKQVLAKNPAYKNSIIHSSFKFKMYYDDLFFNEYKPSLSDAEVNFLLTNYEIDIASFELFPKTKFLLDIFHANDNTIDYQLTRAYTKDVFYNYTPGMLQNHLQEINQRLINEEQTPDIYQSIEKDELKELANSKLYIPETVKIKIEKEEDIERSEKKLKDIFTKYDYQYEFISMTALDEKIQSGEEIYYLRYSRRKDLYYDYHHYSIINSKTGETIYYRPNIKNDMLKFTLGAIGKAIGKMEK